MTNKQEDSMTSNSKQRVMVDADVFGRSVAGSPTGRTMSTPDPDKPVLHEIDLDGSHGLVWLPEVVLSNLTYSVSVLCEQESFASPTDAVLAMLDWLRSPQAGGITFTVVSPDDRLDYTVEATQLDENNPDAWGAEVTAVTGPNYDSNTKSQRPRVPREDLIPNYIAPPMPEPTGIDALVDLVAAKIGTADLTPHHVAQALREAGRPVADATVLQVHQALHARRQGLS